MDYIPQFRGMSGGNTQDVSGLPQDDNLAQFELKRRLARAEALRNAEIPQGQMVGNQFVPPSWTQFLANAVSKYQGGQQEREAMKQYGEYTKTKAQKQADALKALTGDLEGTKTVNQGSYQIQVPSGNAPQTENLGGMQPIETGMKNINVPMATTTTRAPTSGERYAAIMKYGSAINDPRMVQEAIMGNINQANKAEEVAGERTWREQQTKNEQEFNRIMQKDRQGFELTQGEKQFANQMALQKSNQGFQAGENAKNRANQIQLHTASQSAAPSGYKKNADGSLTFIPGGPADPSNKPLTQDQANARLYSTRMSQSHNILSGLEQGGKPSYNPIAIKTILTMPSAISELTNYNASEETQSAAQAMRNFINATLRRESGATITPPEFDNAMKQYFPQVGDKPAVLAQKRANRETAISGIAAAGYSGGVVPNQPQAVDFGSLK